MSRTFLLIFSLVFSFSIDVIGQNQDNKHPFIDCLEKQLQKDDLIINGKVYFSPSQKINGSSYFMDFVHVPGYVYMSGHEYPLERLKLDLFQNQLVVREKLSNSATVELILNPTHVDSFYISDHFFINNSIVGIPNQTQHYMEQIGLGSHKFYRISDVLYSDQIDSRNPNGKFILKQAQYYIHIGNSYKLFKSDRELLKYFPKKKNDIKNYMRKHKFKLKKASLNQLVSLVNYLNALDH